MRSIYRPEPGQTQNRGGGCEGRSVPAVPADLGKPPKDPSLRLNHVKISFVSVRTATVAATVLTFVSAWLQQDFFPSSSCSSFPQSRRCRSDRARELPKSWTLQTPRQRLCDHAELSGFLAPRRAEEPGRPPSHRCSDASFTTRSCPRRPFVLFLRSLRTPATFWGSGIEMTAPPS